MNQSAVSGRDEKKRRHSISEADMESVPASAEAAPSIKETLPDWVRAPLEKLWASGFQGYLVGGCVRDPLLGTAPHDYDLTTNALPEQMKQVFQGMGQMDSGLKHGTLTVFSQGHAVEITTYRIDGEYRDRRRPDRVSFTPCLEEDLARRDFTINAMAYSPKEGLIDPFSGRSDLQQRLLRCVGDPERRFSEDALRILRAVRFQSELGFVLEPRTREALLAQRESLLGISMERITSELLKTLGGKDCQRVLLENALVFAVFLPELRPCFGFSQHSRYHKYDVWEHTCAAVGAVPHGREDTVLLRLALLLHDSGKPSCFTLDEKGGHFKGHEEVSAQIADGALRRLKVPNHLRERVTLLINWHHFWPEEDGARRGVRRLLSKIGPEAFFQLMEIQKADSMAKQDFCRERLPIIRQREQLAREMVNGNQCLSLKDLQINGADLLAMGFSGPALGGELHRLLELVLDEEMPNDRAALLQQAARDQGGTQPAL